MPAYRYLLTDLLTDQTLAQIPLTGVSFDRRISRTGSLSGTLNAPTPVLVGVAKTLHANVGRSALWVYRDNEIWWGGIVWSAVAKQGQRGPVALDVQASTFDSYAHHRQLYVDKTYTGVDQGAIVPDLWRTIQADTGGAIGVLAFDQPTGTVRDLDYYTDDQAYVGRLIEDLGDLVNGPEHTIDVYLDSAGNRIKQLRVAKTLGLPEARVVFQRAARGGGRLLEWAHTADAVDGGTTFTVRSDTGDTSERLFSADLISAGWPLLDLTLDLPASEDTTSETERVWALLAQRAGAVRTYSYTVQVGDTGWSPNRLGDQVRIKISDAWHTDADLTDLNVRPVGVKVTAADTGTPETVELMFGDA